jgi:hypothetical protein
MQARGCISTFGRGALIHKLKQLDTVDLLWQCSNGFSFRIVMACRSWFDDAGPADVLKVFLFGFISKTVAFFLDFK